MYRVFLSHSSKDRPIAERLHAYLEQPFGFPAPPTGLVTKSVEVFLSEYDLAPGPNLDERILAELRRADLFVLLLSQQASQSAYVNQEIGVALERRIPRLIVALEPVQPPAMVSRDNYVRLYEDANAWSAWLKQHIDNQAATKNLKEGVGVILGLFAMLWLFTKSGE